MFFSRSRFTIHGFHHDDIVRKKKKAGHQRFNADHECPYVVVDTELTGLDEKKDSIVSIGAVRMTGGRIELGDMFYRLVSPRTQLTAAVW